jgi:dienelactone hydrolase
MKRLLACALVACGHAAPAPAPTTAATPPPIVDAAVLDVAPPTPEARATAVTDGLAKQDFAGVEKLFAPAVAKALDQAELGNLWTTLGKQAGALKGCEAAHARPAKPGQPTVVIVPCHFGKGDLDFVIALDDTLQVSGLHLAPHTDEKPWSPPPYGATNAVTRELMIDDLPGTLTIPSGTGPFPVVVLVHGSGPNDRDETIGPNKVFADLALGLAAKGVATLRYDKRTNVHPETLPKEFTVDDEVTKDALAAVDVMAKTPPIDSKRIFVLGHSLGALVAPRIAQRSKAVAGIIIMAGPTLPLGDKVVEQMTYIANVDGTIDPDEHKAIDEAKAAAKRIAELEKGAEGKPGEMYIGAPPSYWKDLGGYDAPATAAKLAMPILVLQGERDYQVTKADFAGWQKALGKKKTAKLVLYPKLTHLFMAGEGPSTPAEYDKPAHVDETVIADVASWIGAKK